MIMLWWVIKKASFWSFITGIIVPRVLLDWIAGLFNPDCNPFCWIGVWLTIQFQNWIFDLDWQSSNASSIQIQRNQYFYFLSRKLESSQILKPSQFFLIVSKSLEVVWCWPLNGPLGFHSFKKSNCKQKYFKNIFFIGLWLDLDWIVNPFRKVDLDLDFQS